MKKIITLLSALFVSFSALSQEKYIPKEQDWFFYDLTYLSYLGGPDGIEMNGWSNGHSLSFMRDALIGDSKFSFGYGLGYTSNNYKSNLFMEIQPSSGNAQFALLNDLPDENKLNIKYFEIPVELRFRSRPNDEGNFWRVILGARGGIRFSAYHEFETSNVLRKEFHHDELNRWRAGVYSRVGFGMVNLYAYYGLLNIFDYDHENAVNGLDVNGMNSLAIGLSIGI